MNDLNTNIECKKIIEEQKGIIHLLQSSLEHEILKNQNTNRKISKKEFSGATYCVNIYNENEMLKQRVGDLENSLSWIITAPLRMVKCCAVHSILRRFLKAKWLML